MTLIQSRLRPGLSKLLSSALVIGLLAVIPNAVWNVSIANAASWSSISSQPQWSLGGGGNLDLNCGSGSVLRGAKSGYNSGYPAITAIKSMCDPLNSNGTGTNNSTTVSSTYGGSDTTNIDVYSIDCGQNSVLVGLEMYGSNASGYIGYVTPRCGSLPLGNNVTTPSQYLGGSTTSNHQTINCPTNTVAVGLHLRTGGITDAVGLNCAAITGATQTITFNAPATQTTTSSLTVTATTTSSSSVTFTSGTTSVCTVTSGGVVTFVTTGTCTLNANAAADTNFAVATQVSQSFTVNATSQSISLSVTPTSSTSNGTTYSQALTLSTSGSSGTGAKTFAVTNGTATGCTLSSNTSTTPTLTASSSGTCSITATIASDTRYSTATSSAVSVTFGKATQTVSFTTSKSTGIITQTYVPAATSTSGLGVSITVDATSSGVCSISSGTVTFNAAGTCTLLANQSGDTYNNSASQATQVITVSPGPASALTVTTPGSGSTSGYGFATVPAITVKDSYGNLVANGTTVTATLSLTKGTTLSPTTFSSTGTSTMTATTVNGIATFTGMIIGSATSQALAAGLYTITFSSNGSSASQVNLLSKAKVYSPYSSANNMAGSLLVDYQFNNPSSFNGGTAVTNLVSQTGDNGLVSSSQTFNSTGLHVGLLTATSIRTSSYAEGTSGTGAQNLYAKLTNAGASINTNAHNAIFVTVKFDPVATGCNGQSASNSVCNGHLLTENAGTWDGVGTPGWSLGQLAVFNDRLYYQYWSGAVGGSNALITDVTGNNAIKLKANVWYTIGLTYDGSTMTGWVNGIAQFTVATFNRQFGTTNHASAWYSIGATAPANIPTGSTVAAASSFYLSSFQVYNKELTAAQVKQNYTVALDSYLTASSGRTIQVADVVTGTETFTVTDVSGNAVPGAQVQLSINGVAGNTLNTATGFDDATAALYDCKNTTCSVYSDANGVVLVPSFNAVIAGNQTIFAYSSPTLDYSAANFPVYSNITSTNYFATASIVDTITARSITTPAGDKFLTFAGNWAQQTTSQSLISGLTNLSFEAWIKPTTGCTGECIIGGKDAEFLFATGVPYYANNSMYNQLMWATYPNASTTNSWYWTGTGVSIPVGEWQHVAFVKTGSTGMQMYLNGVLVYSYSTTNVTNNWTNSNGRLAVANIIGSTSNTFGIGARSLTSATTAGASGFTGSIDEVHLYNTAISQSQVQADMQSATPCGTAGLLLYYDFNEGTGTNAASKCSSSTYDLMLSDDASVLPTWGNTTITSTANGMTTVQVNRTVINSAGGIALPDVSKISAVVVAAGGGGGYGYIGGGGGGGGVVVNPTTSITPGAVVPVVVGTAGIGFVGSFIANTVSSYGLAGGNSIFVGATALGGGAGGGNTGAGTGPTSGGSGGGGQTGFNGATAATQSVPAGWTAYGNNGAAGAGGGGGGAGGNASATISTASANGGPGISNVNTFSVTYAGGGGGYSAGTGGSGGGANGVNYTTNMTVTSGTANTGGGGSGGGFGGTGVVVYRYITAKPAYSNPSSIVTTSGLTATFTVANTPVTGLTRTYQWMQSTDTGTTWANVSTGSTNATTGAYTTATTTTAMSGYQYKVVVTDTDASGTGLSLSDTSTAATLTVNPPLLLAANPTSITINYGSAASSIFTATQGTGTKTFTFTPSNIAGISLDTSTASSGVATLNIAASTRAGTYNETITVTDTATATTSTPISITINKIAIAHSVSASSTTPTIGTSITLYDTVTSSVAGTLTPTGTVTFKDASNNILCGPATLNVSAVASCTYTPINTNTILISASYAGDNNYLAASSSAISVTPGKTSILITGVDAVSGFSTSNVSNIVTSTSTSTSVSFTGTLSSYVVGTAPTGTIAVTENGKSACVGTVSSNSATCSWTPNDVGTLSITFTYSGDSNYNGASNTIVLYASMCTETTTATILLGAPGAGYCGIKFTAGSAASFTVPSGVQNAAMVVVGGGGAGGSRAGGGGGAGALLYNSAYALASSTYSVTIGAGGPSGATSQGVCGSDSSFGSITAGGGGGGGGGGGTGSVTCTSVFTRATPANTMAGFTGGSAGGSDGTGGVILANTNQTTPSGWTLNQNAGGNGSSGGGPGYWTGGGGGGAGGAGVTGLSTGVAGNGGAGYSPSITYDGNSICLAGGGGGGAFYSYTVGTATCGGGSGGNTAVAAPAATQAVNATANTGAGGGGGGFGISTSDQSTNGTVGSGGSGVVIMKYISPSVITTSGNLSVTSNTSITLTETATSFTFTRSIIWQYSWDTGTTWTQIQSSNINGAPAATCTTATCTFTIHYSDGTAYHPTQWFRSVISDTDGTLATQSYSPTITVTVAPVAATKLYLASTIGTPGVGLTLFTSGGPVTLGTTYTYKVANGTSSTCSLATGVLTSTNAGTCLVAALAKNVDYLDFLSDTTTVTLFNYVNYIPVAPTPPANSPVIGISGGAPSYTTNTNIAPTITSVPATGSINGALTITGTGFTGTTTVKIGRTRVAFTVNSATSISATIPGTAGTGTITVTNPYGTAVWVSGFTWS